MSVTWTMAPRDANVDTLRSVYTQFPPLPPSKALAVKISTNIVSRGGCLLLLLLLLLLAAAPSLPTTFP